MPIDEITATITTDAVSIDASLEDAGSKWGNIYGNIQDQTDLQTEFATKQNVISDLDTIRSGATKGITSLQPNDIIDNLTTNDATKVLSAKQGKQLQDTKQANIDDLATIRSGASKGATSLQTSDIINDYTSTSTTKALSAAKGRELYNTKQNNLISGTNIKTVDGNPLLGGGDVDLSTSYAPFNSLYTTKNISAGGSTTETLSLTKGIYILGISSGNINVWTYIGIIYRDSSRYKLIQLNNSGLTVSLSSSTLTIVNTNTQYSVDVSIYVRRI